MPRHTVLLVESDQDVRDMIAMLLEHWVGEVRTAANRLEALQLLRDGLRPAIIVAELCAQPIGGADFIDRVRALGLEATPVLVASAAKTRGSSPGVDFLAKPFDSELLVRTVNTLLGSATTH